MLCHGFNNYVGYAWQTTSGCQSGTTFALECMNQLYMPAVARNCIPATLGTATMVAEAQCMGVTFDLRPRRALHSSFVGVACTTRLQVHHT